MPLSRSERADSKETSQLPNLTWARTAHQPPANFEFRSFVNLYQATEDSEASPIPSPANHKLLDKRKMNENDLKFKPSRKHIWAHIPSCPVGTYKNTCCCGIFASQFKICLYTYMHRYLYTYTCIKLYTLWSDRPCHRDHNPYPILPGPTGTQAAASQKKTYHVPSPRQVLDCKFHHQNDK